MATRKANPLTLDAIVDNPDLLRTIGYAFDEWRVRESDVVQRLSGALGVFLALIGVVTVLDATVALKPANSATIFGGGTISENFAVGARTSMVVAVTCGRSSAFAGSSCNASIV